MSKNKNNSVFIVMGASGDLSKKKIYPTLWSLYKQNYISSNSIFIGYARSKMSINDLIEKYSQYIPDKDRKESHEKLKAFYSQNYYFNGSYTESDYFVNLDKFINQLTDNKLFNRIFYLALPPTVFSSVTELVRNYCWVKGENVWGRIIIEKPFGHDLESSNALSKHISSMYEESEVYRIDHYLGKEMVKNILVLRFGNILFRPIWNRDFITSVQITFKEPFGVEGRGGYFDSAGIIRDIIQNHLVQIMSLIAMDKPLTISATDIRGEKLKVLRAIKPLILKDLVTGQYVGNHNAEDPRQRLSYKDVEGVPKDSITPTYACAVLYVNNESWDGVPFILRCGKALNERKAEIRIQFKAVPGDIFGTGQLKRNELVIRVQPGEAIYVKLMTKRPGGNNDNTIQQDQQMEQQLPQSQQVISLEETELELTYNERYRDIRVPDAYENLILDVFNGLQMDFVHVDELREAWRIVDQALKDLEKYRVKPFNYVFGSRNGPPEADDLIKQKGFMYSGTYVYNKQITASL